MKLAVFFAFAGLATVLIGHFVMHSFDVTLSGMAVAILAIGTWLVHIRDEWNGSE